MKSKLELSATRASRIGAVALLVGMATCRDDPTSLPTAAVSVPDMTSSAVAAADPVTPTLLTSGNNTVNQSTYTTASISPAPNALITIAVMGHRSYGANPSPIVTGGGMSAWEEVATVTFDPIGAPLKRMTVYRAMSAAPGSGPITITFAASVSHAQWIVLQWQGVDQSGTNGSGAIVQTATARADNASGLAVSLAAFANASNVAYGIFGVKSSVVAITPGSGFTEIAEVASAESPHSDLQSQWATNDNTIDASWVNLHGGAIGIEIKAGEPAEPPPPPPPPPPVSPSQSTVAADPASIPGDGTASTITVTVKDESGAPISGATVVLSATGDGNTLTQPAGTTNASGVATGSLSSTVVGSKTVSATANGTAITQTASIEVTEPPPPPPPPTSHPVTHTLLTSGNHTTNQSTFTTASISPAPNTLITIAVQGHNSSSAAPAPVITGGGMTTWTLVATTTYDALSGSDKRLAIFRAMSASPGSGPITIRFSKSQSNAQWIVSQWDGVDISGENGAGAIVQTALARQNTVNGITLTMAPFGDANNAAYGVFGVNSRVPAVTPGTGFTEIAEQSSNESPSSGLQAEWTWNDNTIDASWSSLRAAALGVEIKAGQHGPQQPVVSVEVSPTSASLLVGETVQLTATAQNAEGEPLPGRPATWSSDAPSVASVSSTGLVKGEGVGSATITATIEGKTGTSSVSVTTSTVPVATVEVTPVSADLTVGGTVQLTAVAKDANGQPLSGRTFSWSSDATSVARVSATGLVTGEGAGTATITATTEGKSGSSSVTVTSGGQDAIVGRWSSVFSTPNMILVHTHLMLDGRVVMFGKGGVPQIWNPATGSFTAVPSNDLLFCAGHDWLPDGNLLVVGGHIAPSRGLAVTNIFDNATSSWRSVQPMAQGRWYPSATTLPNGEVVAISGEDANGNTVALPEVWNGSSWRQLTGASLSLSNYPRAFVAPDGRVFVAGSSRDTRYLDVTGNGSWSNGPQRLFGGRSYGAAVMYEPGKIIYIGGSNPPTNTAEIIDLNQAGAQWSYTGSLSTARWNHNATLLPTGEILVTGGVAGDRSNAGLKVNTTELWNPASGSWRTLAPSAPLLRGYHSSSLLLPDGRILHGGGGDGGGTVENFNYEIYSPPYLFRGARPTVTGSTPSTVGYGQQIFVATPDAASITKVSFIRFGSVTHAMDWGQRFLPLTFTQVAGGINVTIPSSRTAATPGPYMLFLVNGNGVPSVARSMVLR